MASYSSLSKAQPIPIFVISLARSIDRRQAISKRLQALGLDFEFFEAVDGANFPSEYEAMVDRSFTKMRAVHYRDLCPTEIACALSHALLYKKIIDLELPAAIILEDDAIPSQGLVSLLKDNTLQKAKKIELGLLGYSTHYAWRWNKFKLDGYFQAFRPIEMPLTSTGYYLTRKAAIALYLAALPISTVADWPAPIHLWPHTYSLSPQAIDPNFNQALSTIEAQRVETVDRHVRAQIEDWPLFKRWLGRMLALTFIPCLVWPNVFGSFSALSKLVRRAIFYTLAYPFTQKIEGHNSRSFKDLLFGDKRDVLF